VGLGAGRRAARLAQDRGVAQGAVRAGEEDLLDVAPLVRGEGEPGAQDALEDAPLVQPGPGVRRSAAGQSLSSAFRGGSTRAGGAGRPGREDAPANGEEAQQSVPASEQPAPLEAEPEAQAPAAEQLRRPSF